MSLPCAKTLTFYSKINCDGFWKGANHDKQGTEGEKQGKKEEKEREAKATQEVARCSCLSKSKNKFFRPPDQFFDLGDVSSIVSIHAPNEGSDVGTAGLWFVFTVVSMREENHRTHPRFNPQLLTFDASSLVGAGEATVFAWEEAK